MMETVFFASASDLRAWLEENHDSVEGLWIGFYKKHTGKPGITYAEALDEALCLGWIDGIRKRVDDDSYTIRFTPRRPGSIWSNVNVKRFGELRELGLVQPPGVRAYQEGDWKKSGSYLYEQPTHVLDDAYEAQFRASQPAWEFFEAQPPSYRKSATGWVMSAKREETRLRRLSTLIEDSENGRRLANFSRKARS